MGMFQYPVTLLSADGRREEEVRPWVDTGAIYCQFPAPLLESLGYKPNSSRVFTLADGTQLTRPFGAVSMRLGGEVQPVHCVFAPGDDNVVLLGAIALEAFSLMADPVARTLKPIVGMMLTMLSDEEPYT